MFHIKNDARFLKSSEMLYQGLCSCIKRKSFDEITVSDISKESTVSRATFYRNFDCITDVLYWKCDQRFSSVLRECVDHTESTEDRMDFLLQIFQRWMENTEILELLIQIKRIDIIYNCFRANAHIITDHIKNYHLYDSAECDYYIYIRIGIFIGIVQAWLEHGKRESASDIVSILEHQVNDTLAGGTIL